MSRLLDALIPFARLLRRSAPPRSRHDELVSLRARFRAQPGPREAGADATESALRLEALRVEMSRAFGHVDACRSCAKGRPEPNGHWPGGSCCGSRTLDLFTPVEVAALKLAGVRADDLRPPRGDHAGCAFRAEEGCVLPPEHRPSLCVRYVCLELRAEVIEKPEWRRISALGAALREESARFEALIAASHHDEDSLHHRRSTVTLSTSSVTEGDVIPIDDKLRSNPIVVNVVSGVVPMFVALAATVPFQLTLTEPEVGDSTRSNAACVHVPIGGKVLGD